MTVGARECPFSATVCTAIITQHEEKSCINSTSRGHDVYLQANTSMQVELSCMHRVLYTLGV